MSAPEIMVVQLGPGDPNMLTLNAVNVLSHPGNRIILRTGRHPVADWLNEKQIVYETLDHFYEKYDDFDQMYHDMAVWLWKEAQRSPLIFGIPDLLTDASVRFLKAGIPGAAKLRVLPGVSQADNCIASFPQGLFPDENLHIFSATSFLHQTYSPFSPVLITEIDSELLAGEIKIKILDYLDDDQPVVFFPPSESSPRPARMIHLHELDMQKKYNHMAALYVPDVSFPHRSRYTFEDLNQIVSLLRAPNGCPWDAVQTHDSLRPYMVEEAWEAVSAIDEKDSEHLADELGDVLFQVFIHTSIAQNFDEFTMTDVVSNICHKMIYRHPYVFSDTSNHSDQSLQNWESIKRSEKKWNTVGETLDDVPNSLPSLKYAAKMLKKLAQIPALQRQPEEVAAEIKEITASMNKQNGSVSVKSMRRLLLNCSEMCFISGMDAEMLLHQAVEKMKKKYQFAESLVIQDEKKPENLTFQELSVYLESAEDEIE